MFFYDLNLSAWVRKPGSKSPPEMTPVMGIGGVFDFQVAFCRSIQIENPIASAWLAGIKVEGDYSGDYVASDNAPEVDGNESMRFIFDLTTAEASAYFTANPMKESFYAIVQIKYTDAFAVERVTSPLRVVIQQDYLTTP